MLGPTEFALSIIQRLLFGNPSSLKPTKNDSPVQGSISFVNCLNGCPGPISTIHKPCPVFIHPDGIRFAWGGEKYFIRETGKFEVKFLRSGEVVIHRCAFDHDCYPRTFFDAIEQGHKRAIANLLENGEEPSLDDVEHADRLGYFEIAGLLRENREQEGFLLVRPPSEDQ